MHDLCVSHGVKEPQKGMFRQASLPQARMNGQNAHQACIGGKRERLPMAQVEDLLATEEDPSGVLCVVSGEE